jgi:hypothetical protein
MTIDIAKQIGAISRQVEQQQSEAGEIVTVTMERRYPAEVADVRQAITDLERVRLWLQPTVPRCRTSMSSRSKSGLPSSRPQGRLTLMQLQPPSRPRWRSSLPMSFGQSER